MHKTVCLGILATMGAAAHGSITFSNHTSSGSLRVATFAHDTGPAPISGFAPQTVMFNDSAGIGYSQAARADYSARIVQASYPVQLPGDPDVTIFYGDRVESGVGYHISSYVPDPDAIALVDATISTSLTFTLSQATALVFWGTAFHQAYGTLAASSQFWMDGADVTATADNYNYITMSAGTHVFSSVYSLRAEQNGLMVESINGNRGTGLFVGVAPSPGTACGLLAPLCAIATRRRR